MYTIEFNKQHMIVEVFTPGGECVECYERFYGESLKDLLDIAKRNFPENKVVIIERISDKR